MKFGFGVHPGYRDKKLEEKKIKYYDLIECFEEIGTF